MAKVNIKSEKITPLVEIYYVSKTFYVLSLDIVVNGHARLLSACRRHAKRENFINVSSCMEDILVILSCLFHYKVNIRYIAQAPNAFPLVYYASCSYSFLFIVIPKPGVFTIYLYFYTGYASS